MEAKVFEVLDSATCMIAVGVKMKSDDQQVSRLLAHAGYARHATSYILLTFLTDTRATYDPYDWGDRTRFNAHFYITERWDELKSGDVVDVEYILGETITPRKSDVSLYY